MVGTFNQIYHLLYFFAMGFFISLPADFLTFYKGTKKLVLKAMGTAVYGALLFFGYLFIKFFAKIGDFRLYMAAIYLCGSWLERKIFNKTVAFFSLCVYNILRKVYKIFTRLGKGIADLAKRRRYVRRKNEKVNSCLRRVGGASSYRAAEHYGISDGGNEGNPKQNRPVKLRDRPAGKPEGGR